MCTLFFFIFLNSVLPEIDYVYTPGVFLSDRGMVLRIYFDIDMDKLTLIKEGEKFTAAYSISILLKRDDREKGNIWMRRVEDLEYDTKQIAFDTIMVDISPGTYQMNVILSDLNSQKSTEKESTISIDSLTPGFSISSMIPFKNKYLLTGNRITSIEGIAYYLEVYTDRETMFYFTVEDYKDSLSVKPGTTPIYVEPKISKISANSVILTAAIHRDYEILQRSDTLYLGSSIFEDEGLFMDRVKALTYIFDTPMLDTLLSAKPEKRDSLWNALWKRFDPTPETERNELKDEYLTRIDYVDTYLGGWQTDMGRVWLVMGIPDEIDRHPFEIEIWAYEVWYYYSTNEKFIFYDRHGLGYYELVYPENWNPWREK